MSYMPEYNQGIPQQTVFTRNVRSTIFELKSYIMRCPDSQSALNAWSLLCEFEYAVCMNLLNARDLNLEEVAKLPPDTDVMNWTDYVQKLKTEFEGMKTSEKTEIKVISTGVRDKYSVQWDSYIGEFAPQEFEKGVEVMDKEKYDAIRNGLMKIVGKLEFALLASGELRMGDKLEIAVPLDVYTEEQSHDAIESRKGSSRQIGQKTPPRK